MVDNSRCGFSLLELAIVLIIIALIIGGGLTARSMIRAAQVNSVVSDFTRYTQAITNFQDKYHALPGDMRGAEAIWGTDTVYGCPGIPTNPPPPAHIATCDGDGNGKIAYSSSSSGWDITSPEVARAWQQLANAGFIQGAYNGVSGMGGGNIFVSLPGVNVPASQVPGAGYTLWYIDNQTITTSDWQGVGHIFMFGGVGPNLYTNKPALTTSEAYGIDSKIDDGVPSTGYVKSERNGANPSAPPCNANDSDPTTAQYNVSNSTAAACAILLYLKL